MRREPAVETVGVTIFAPDRSRGVTVGVLASLWSAALGIGILATLSGADVTWGAFLLLIVGGALLALGLLFAYWTYCCATMSYEVDESALRVRWGPQEVVVPLAKIDVVAAAPAPARVTGLNWPGHHVGRTLLQGTAVAHVFATDYVNGEAVYVRAGRVILALTPRDPATFIEYIENRRRSAPPLAAPARTRTFDARSFLADRTWQGMAVAAAVLNIAAFGVLFVRYDALPGAVRVDYPADSDIARVVDRGDLFEIPMTGLVLLVANLVLSAVMHRSQRALSQTVAGGTVMLETGVIIAVMLAVQ